MTEPSIQPAPQRLSHHGNVRELLAITLVNLLLKVITLGIYHFWAKSRVRRYLWSHTRFAGEPLEYTGVGRELARGYTRAIVWLLPLALFWGLYFFLLSGFDLPGPEGWEPLAHLFWLTPLLIVAGFAYLLFLIGLARYGARRYLLGHTRWRGIRCALSGSAAGHGRKMLWYSILTGLTFGIYFPYMRHNLNENLINHTWFGDRRLSYRGKGGHLVGRYWGFVGLSIVFGILWSWLVNPLLLQALEALGRQSQGQPEVLIFVVSLAIGLLSYLPFAIAWYWFRAGELRYYVNNTTFGDVPLVTDFSTVPAVWLWIGNFLLLGATLGLAYAWVAVRTVRYFSDHLFLAGEIDPSAIGQSPEEVLRAGEGLAEALDLGSF